MSISGVTLVLFGDTLGSSIVVVWISASNTVSSYELMYERLSCIF